MTIPFNLIKKSSCYSPLKKRRSCANCDKAEGCSANRKDWSVKWLDLAKCGCLDYVNEKVFALEAEDELRRQEAEARKGGRGLKNTPVEDVKEFGTRLRKVLMEQGIVKVGGICAFRESELARKQGFGRKTMELLKNYLEQHNLKFKEEEK